MRTQQAFQAKVVVCGGLGQSTAAATLQPFLALGEFFSVPELLDDIQPVPAREIPCLKGLKPGLSSNSFQILPRTSN